MWLFTGVVLLAINLWLGINDIEAGRTTKTAAFSWFVVGWLTFEVIHQFIKLL